MIPRVLLGEVPTSTVTVWRRSDGSNARAGIVTETGPGEIGGSGKMLACPCSTTGAIASPPVIIQHAVWLYLRFTLSYRDGEELLAERGSTSPMKPCGVGC